jgi:CBS domain-containing protein
MLHIRDVMQTPVWTVSPTTPLTEVQRQFREHAVRHLPVVERGQVVGMITVGDATAAGENPARQRAAALPIARSFMSNPAVNISSAAPVGDAIRLMLRHRISAMPVVRGARIVGIITASDVLRALITGRFVRYAAPPEPLTDDPQAEFAAA